MGQNININNQYDMGMSPQSYVVIETADYEGSNDDGTVTVPPGETRTILDFDSRGDAFNLLASGASDSLDLSYTVKNGQDIVYRTESPLGTINDPFTFAERFGKPITATDYLTYEVTNNSDSDKKAAARWHLEVLG